MGMALLGRPAGLICRVFASLALAAGMENPFQRLWKRYQ